MRCQGRAPAGAATCNPGMSSTVNAINISDSVAYLGGSFTSVGSCVSFGAAISVANGNVCDIELPDVSEQSMQLPGR